jgi:hypothetical protein
MTPVVRRQVNANIAAMQVMEELALKDPAKRTVEASPFTVVINGDGDFDRVIYWSPEGVYRTLADILIHGYAPQILSVEAANREVA